MSSIVEISQKRNQKSNAQEKLKIGFSHSELRFRLLEYAKNGYESISDADKNFLLKNFGLFDRPATPKHFMLRVRIAGGRLNASQANEIGVIAREYGNDYIDITTRAQVELRYLKIEDIPTIFDRLGSVGISTYQTGVDNFRNIVCDPFGLKSEDALIDCFETARELETLFLHQDEWICTLPRKFNIAISGATTNRCNIFGHDFALVLARKNSQMGYNLYLGGKVGALAKSADIFIAHNESKELFSATAKMYKELGFRDNRNKNRLKFLIDAVGMEEIRTTIERYAKRTFERSGETLCKLENEQKVKTELKDNVSALLLPIGAGIFSGSEMIEASRIASHYGDGDIRLSIEQKLYICGIRENDIANIHQTALFTKYKKNYSAFHQRLVACAGSEHCPFGVIKGKPDALKIADYLSNKFYLDTPIRMHWSACPKGCGIHGIADIGFVGTKTSKNGVSTLAVDVYIGGSLHNEEGEGAVVLKAVGLDEVGVICEQIIEQYIKLRSERESFDEFYKRVLSKFSHQAIGFLMQYNSMVQETQKLSFCEPSNKIEANEIYLFANELFKKQNLPQFLSPIIAKMNQRDISNRYATFKDILVDLQRLHTTNKESN